MSHKESNQQEEHASTPTTSDQETNYVQVITGEQFNVGTEGLSDDRRFFERFCFILMGPMSFAFFYRE